MGAFGKGFVQGATWCVIFYLMIGLIGNWMHGWPLACVLIVGAFIGCISNDIIDALWKADKPRDNSAKVVRH